MYTYYVEVFDDDFTTDSAVQTLSGFSGTTIGGHTHIEGKTAAIIRDNIFDASSVVSSGNGTAADTPTSFVEVGLDYEVVVETMPVEFMFESVRRAITSLGVARMLKLCYSLNYLVFG